MSLIGDLIVEGLCYGTASLAIRALTAGRVQPQPYLSDEALGWAGYKRREDGVVVLNATITAGLGMLIWALGLVAVLSWLR